MRKNKLLIIILFGILTLVLLYISYYIYNSTKPSGITSINLPAEVSTENWVNVTGEGYEFMHPGFEIRDNGSYYVIAYKPEVIGGYPNVSIQKPVKVESIDGYLGEYIANSGSGAGISADSPFKATRTTVDGFDDAYIYEYESDWAKEPGLYRLLFLKSSYDNNWTIIQMPVGDKTAEKIVESFKFTN